MLKSQDIIPVDKPALEKNAVVGKLSLQNKLHKLSSNQNKAHNISGLLQDVPVLKYRTQISNSPLESHSPILTPNSGCRPLPRYIQVPQAVHLSEKPDQTLLQIPVPCVDTTNPVQFSDECVNSENRLSALQKQNNGCACSVNQLAVPSLPSTRFALADSLVCHTSIDYRSDQQRKNMSSGSSTRTRQSIRNSGTLNSSSCTTSTKPPHFSPSIHYTPSVSKSLNYQTWSSSILPMPGKNRPGSATSHIVNNNKATNTMDSFLRQSNTSLETPHSHGSNLLMHGKHRPVSSNTQRFFKKQMQETKSCPNVNATDTDAITPEQIWSSNESNPEYNLKGLAVTNGKPKSKPLLTSSRGTFTSNKIGIPSCDASKQKSRIIRSKVRPGLQHTFDTLHARSNGSSNTGNAAPLAHHVSSIPNQNSRLVFDESFAILNSSSSYRPNRIPRILSPHHLEVYNDADTAPTKLRRQARLLTLQPPKLPKSPTKKTRVCKSAKSKKGCSRTSEPSSDISSENVSSTVTKLHQVSLGSTHKRIAYAKDTLSYDSSDVNVNSLSPEIVPPYRKNSNDSGNGTLSAKSRRSCGDGADQNSPENETRRLHKGSRCEEVEEWKLKRQPGDGEDEPKDIQKVDDSNEAYDYADSYIDDENSGDGVQDEFGDEFFDGASCCQDSDIGTGEFFPCDNLDDFDCVDDSVAASLEDGDVGSEEAESESSASASRCISMSGEHHDATVKNENCKPALIKSIFSKCPPVINFATKFEEIEALSHNNRKLLKWKMSTITPIVVRNTVMRSGFKPSKKNHDWMGYFGKHMKSNGFRSLREYQKMNHFPGSFQLGRKDRLWRNISRMQTRFGKKEFGFVPQSYVLPWDKKLLKNAWEEGGTKQKYILKPPASARGIGIRVIHKWNQIPIKKPIMVQKYLARPYLINGNKFDLRLYVHVTSFDPLRIYLFEDGLVRFATCKYSSSMKHLSNRYMHLTNYSINKKSGEFQQNDDATICQGHKWSLKALWGYMQQSGINTDKIWEQMKDIVIKTIISVEQFTNSLIKSNCRRRYCCHELFGFDVMLDDRLRPWLLEVNISPSLHSNSPLDVEIKGPMVKDMFNLCGFLLPDKKVLLANASPPNAGNGVVSAVASFSQDKRKQGQEVTADSKAKHTYFAQHYKQMDEQEMISFMLDILTINDIQMLVESEAEVARCGDFKQIFPSTNRKYLQYFEQPRYYNVFLYAWEVKNRHQKARANAMLESYCRKGLHLPQCLTDQTNIPVENIWNTSAMNQHKILPSPRTDVKLLPVVIKPSSGGLSPYSSTIMTTVAPSSGRARSASSQHGTGHSSMIKMVVTSKPLFPVSSLKLRTQK